MKTISFNTGRHYTAHGQRIVATLHDDGVITFHDIDRMITGQLRYTGATEAEFTKENILSEYDRLLYDGTSRAWQDGMLRGGVNTLEEVDRLAREAAEAAEQAEEDERDRREAAAENQRTAERSERKFGGRDYS